MPNQDVQYDDNVNEVTATVSTFYTELFTTPIKGGKMKVLLKRKKIRL